MVYQDNNNDYASKGVGTAGLTTGIIGTVGTAIVGEVPKIAELITGEPLLLLTVGFLFFGGCIGIFGRLLSRN